MSARLTHLTSQPQTTPLKLFFIILDVEINYKTTLSFHCSLTEQRIYTY